MGLFGCSEVVEPESEDPDAGSPWEVSAASLLLGDPWETDGYCDWGTGDPPEISGIHLLRFPHNQEDDWAVCWCESGFDMLNPGFVDFNTMVYDAPTCVCANGSTNPDCEPDDPPCPYAPCAPPGPTIPPDTADVTLTCDTGVTRGESGGCHLDVSSGNATFQDIQWETELPEIGPIGKQGGESWEGPIVMDAMVTASGTVSIPGLGVQGFALFDQLSVAPRGANWEWGEDQWDFDPIPTGPAHLLANYPFTVAQATGSGITLGLWCPNLPANCVMGTSFLHPDSANIQEGYTVSEVPAGGPNAGLHYVSAWDFSTKSGWAVHPHLRPDSDELFTGMTSCNNVNWWDANVCEGVASATLAELLQGVENHEALGSNGDNGHQSIAQAVAAQHDPAGAIEDMVGPSAADVAEWVETLIASLREDLDTALNAAPHASGNYGPRTVYLVDNGSVWESILLSGDGGE